MELKTFKKIITIVTSVVFYICFFSLLFLLPDLKSRIIGGILVFIIILCVIYRQGVKYGMKKIEENELPMSRHFFTNDN